MFGVEYDQCLCGGVPAVWPHSPRWPTDAVAHSRILTNIDNDEVRSMLSVSSFLLENYKSQRLMDVAWLHFNHLRDKYAADGILRTIPEWVELICVPTGWDGEPLLKSGREGPDPLQARSLECGAHDFAKVYMKHMTLAPNAASISRRSLQRKCDYCKKPTTGECAVCGEACCSRECMLKLGRNHRKECEMVHENGGSIASILTLFEMKDALTPDEFKAATGGFFDIIASGARGSDSREGKKGASRVAVEGWNKVCGALGCEKNSCAMKCSKCRVIYYCGRECQTKDWKAHKRVCAQMANGKVKPLES